MKKSLKIPKGRLEGQTTHWPKKNDKRTNNDLQNTTQKTNNEQHDPHLTRGIQVLRKGRYFCSTSGTRCVTLVSNPVISYE